MDTDNKFASFFNEHEKKILKSSKASFASEVNLEDWKMNELSFITDASYEPLV